jgi:hypothetical protein
VSSCSCGGIASQSPATNTVADADRSKLEVVQFQRQPWDCEYQRWTQGGGIPDQTNFGIPETDIMHGTKLPPAMMRVSTIRNLKDNPSCLHSSCR